MINVVANECACGIAAWGQSTLWVDFSCHMRCPAFDYINGKEYGLSHGAFVRLVFPCDGVGCAMVGGSSYCWKACSKVHSVFKSDILEGHQSLIVIHGQDTVEFLVLP